MARKTVYTEEFKRQAVLLTETSGRSVREVAAELNVPSSNLVRWRRLQGISPERAPSGTRQLKSEVEELQLRIRQLEKEKKAVEMERRDPKKSSGLLREKPSVRYAVVAAEKAEFPVVTLCKTLEVSLSGFYEWACRAASTRAKKNLEIVEQLRALHAEHRARYGSRRHQQALAGRGIALGRNRVRKLMRLVNVNAKQRRAFKVTTNSDHDKPIAANHLARQFSPTFPNQAWVGDITYLPTSEGWLYLAIVIDLFSRKVVGWAVSTRMTQGLVLEAFRTAVGRRGCRPRMMFHSDQGSQYASAAFQKALTNRGVICSMSRRGNCWDNAVSESFFATLEKELMVDLVGKDRRTVREEVILYIEGYYNQQRLHSTLNYRTPLEYERSAAEVDDCLQTA